ncbi:MAG: right-handed parallel beta-helix repeat-containing protein [Saprospiraceae bacterium]|nr:right-handed parallel beta-helix repeat-containing protein [Saprospiraceae bacterium]
MKFNFILMVILCQFQVYATTYYVSTTGRNSAPGSREDPWASIQFAIEQVVPGDTIALLAGIYSERISFTQSGTIFNPIVLWSPPEEHAIINGDGHFEQDALIEIIDQSFITIRGLTLTDHTTQGAQGILVEGNCLGISIIANDISQINFGSGDPVDSDLDNAQPIIVYGSNGSAPVSSLTIKSNKIHDCLTGFSEGIAVNGNVDGFSIENNEVDNISNIGIDAIGGEQTSSINDQARNGRIVDNDVKNCISPYASAAGIYVDGGAMIIIERNLVTGCQYGIEVGCENPGTASNITVRNNFLYNNADAAIAVGGYDYPHTGRVTNSIIRNNTALENDVNPGGVGGITGQLTITATDNLDVINNIFYQNSGSLLMLSVNSGSTGLNLNYNLYFSSGPSAFDYEGTIFNSLTGYVSKTMQDFNSIFADPQLQISSQGVSFHLGNPNSPAINAGDPHTSIAEGELDGYHDDDRINNDIIDIGADEYGGILLVRYLKPFKATLIDDFVELTWETADEVDNSSFIVQRSIDLQVWDSVVELEAQGQPTFYQWQDAVPVSGKFYYRLRQVDLDGMVSISPVRSIEKRVTKLAIFPNPVRSSFRIEGEIEYLYKVVLRNTSGQVLKTWTECDSGDNFDVYGISPGIYVITLQSMNTIQNIKLAINYWNT